MNIKLLKKEVEKKDCDTMLLEYFEKLYEGFKKV